MIPPDILSSPKFALAIVFTWIIDVRNEMRILGDKVDKTRGVKKLKQG